MAVRAEPAAAGARSVGVDLAWGTRAGTGLAVLDDGGRLLDLVDARTDDEIDAWLHRWAPGPCVVGIDAPVVVRNPTGSRPCERELTRWFARHHAGAHPANTANPAFAGGSTRALRLASRHGLDVDPASAADRRALEVYPHPATVALFGLPTVLRYKHKPGRDLALLRSQLQALLDHLESLHGAEPPLLVAGHPRWQEVRRTVHEAVRKADLRRVEDRVDAVVCAYVALLARLAPERVHVFGDVHEGYIVTPVTAAIAAARGEQLRSAAGPARRSPRPG